MTPEQGLKHNWIKRSKVQSMFKENQMASKFILKDLEDVMRPLPTNKRERQQHNRQLQVIQQASGRASGAGSAQYDIDAYHDNAASLGHTDSSAGISQSLSSQAPNSHNSARHQSSSN
jgi:hypothetical protein